MQKLFWLALAGAVGTLARYGVAVWIPRSTGGLAWATLLVNCVGCFIFGCVWTLAVERGLIGPDLRVMIMAGFLGAFTTFSTFMFEIGDLLRHSAYGAAAACFLANNVLGLLLFFFGHWMCREG